MTEHNAEGKSTKLWGGRFASDMADIALDYSESTVADSEMIAEDIWGSQAHAIMLTACGIISEDDLRPILAGLRKTETEFEAGQFTLKRELEDVHMNVEAYLRADSGPEFAGKLHTGRSRNDQVVTDARMHLRTRLLGVQAVLTDLQRALLAQAEGHERTVMPGYTHTQHAQPISLAFWLTTYVSMFTRDQRRLANAYEIVNQNPLGAAALAGTSFPTDRELSARLLGFDGCHEHALDVISSRDWAVEALFALTMLMCNLSRLAEEFVLFSTYEYRMIEIDDAYSSGSSIMPQKKNPCIAELSRGNTGAVYGRLMELLTLLKALPSGYNRDFQQDKPPLWHALRLVEQTIVAMTAMVETVKFNTEHMREVVGRNFATATELANYLVADRGLAFRTCHELVGQLVATLIAEGKTLDDHEDVQRILAAHGQDLTLDEIAGVCDPEACLARQRSLGSTGPDSVLQMSRRFTEMVSANASAVEQRMEHLQQAHEKTRHIVDTVIAGGSLSDCNLQV
ncbi:MAG: argininosuccinate lyase [candidate division WS1 bacterium]|nr:argininosuccinate lyase [candidate division WS1 bacterium]